MTASKTGNSKTINSYLCFEYSVRNLDSDFGTLWAAPSLQLDFAEIPLTEHSNEGPIEFLKPIKGIDGFVRDMAKHGDYLFIGLSKLRQNSSTFRDLPIAKRSIYCGIEIVHLPTATRVGNIRYQSSIEELYDVQIIPKIRPEILNHLKGQHRLALNTPQMDYSSKPEPEIGNEHLFRR